VRVGDGGELLAKICGLLGSVTILVCVVVSDVAWVHGLDGVSDQSDGMGKALVRAVASGLLRGCSRLPRGSSA
jgi:hypothetical protein